jgi:uncharacterized protein (TIGR03083 family)
VDDDGGWRLPRCGGGEESNAEVYRAMRYDVTALLDSAGDEVGERLVAACPAWRVRDLAAHLSGVATDVLDGNLEGVATDAWTARQVEARRHLTLAEVLEEWSTNGPRLEELLDVAGADLDPRLLLDTWTHQHDLRAALGVGPASDPIARWHAAQTLARRVDSLVEAGRVPPMEVVLDGSPRIERGRHVELRLSAHEWARGLLGRRSRRQVLAWPWVGADPSPFVDELAVFGWSPQDQQGCPPPGAGLSSGRRWACARGSPSCGGR